MVRTQNKDTRRMAHALRAIAFAAFLWGMSCQAVQCPALVSVGGDGTAALFQAPDAPLTLDPAELAQMQAYFQGTPAGILGVSFGYGRPLENPLPKQGDWSYMDMFGPLGFQPLAQRGKVVVDVGAGFSPAVDTLAEVYGAKAAAVDLIFDPRFGEKADLPNRSQAAVRERMQRDHLNPSRRIAGSATRLPFESNSVDVILDSNHLYYLTGAEGGKAVAYELALYEMLRVLKPGGKSYLFGNPERAELVLTQWQIPFHRDGEGLVFTKPENFPVVPITRLRYDRRTVMTAAELAVVAGLKSADPGARAAAEQKLALLDKERVLLIREYFRYQDDSVPWQEIHKILLRILP